MTDEPEHTQEFTAHEKAAKITYEIVSGHELTTAEIAERTGVTWRGAHKMMESISRVVPIYRAGAVWRRV